MYIIRYYKQTSALGNGVEKMDYMELSLKVWQSLNYSIHVLTFLKLLLGTKDTLNFEKHMQLKVFIIFAFHHICRLFVNFQNSSSTDCHTKQKMERLILSSSSLLLRPET